MANVATFARHLRQDVATDEVRKASRARAPDSPMSSEGMEPERLDQTKNTSDEEMPMALGPIEFSGRLLIATDGLFKYATESEIASRAMGGSINEAVARLIAGVRLRSGTLQDDVGIILIEDALSLSAGDAGHPEA
jgi:hypothetical protein